MMRYLIAALIIGIPIAIVIFAIAARTLEYLVKIMG